MTDKMVILSLLNLGNYVGTEPIELTKLEDAEVERERERDQMPQTAITDLQKSSDSTISSNNLKPFGCYMEIHE